MTSTHDQQTPADQSERVLNILGTAYITEYQSLEVRALDHKNDKYGEPLSLALSAMPTSDLFIEGVKKYVGSQSSSSLWFEAAHRQVKEHCLFVLGIKVGAGALVWDDTQWVTATNAINVAFHNTFLAVQKADAFRPTTPASRDLDGLVP